MPSYTLKSSQYLEYIHEKRCAVCGSSTIEAHHESLHPNFRGSRKKRCDYTALPLCNEHHIERHALGIQSFWNKYSINPTKLATKFLTDYEQSVHPRRFGGDEEYAEELENVLDIIEALQRLL